MKQNIRFKNTFTPSIFLVLLFVMPVYAIWHEILVEDFNKDPQDANQRWPWTTHPDNEPPVRWHWNPMNPHRLAEGEERSNYCWGLQDYIFNSRLTPNAEFQYALWCAYTDRDNVDEPRWPDNEDYMHNQNAWVWWGPFDLSGMNRAVISYWLYLYLDFYARDSLSTFAINRDPANLISDNFFENIPIGNIHSRRYGWGFRTSQFNLDSLTMAGDRDNRISMLGEDEVWFGFVWQSDDMGITGRGVFIDDIILRCNDGLFDLAVGNSRYGYPVNEDSTNWCREQPINNQEIYFRLYYRVFGAGIIPRFRIYCYLDDEIIHQEYIRVFEVNEDRVYHVETPDIWRATPDSHVVRWEIDAPLNNGGQVEEGNEDNNALVVPFFVDSNPVPEFEITYPNEDPVILDGSEAARIEWSIDDENIDSLYGVHLFWTADTSGFAEAPLDFVDEAHYFKTIKQYDLGGGSFFWRACEYSDSITTEEPFWIAGYANDTWARNRSFSLSTGRFRFEPLKTNDKVQQIPRVSFLNVIPNPFNDMATIRFQSTENAQSVLSIYDYRGKKVIELFSGKNLGGVQKVRWKPKAIPAGVYFAQLKLEREVFIRKLVYLP